MPYQDTLVSLMNAEDFRDIVGTDIWRRMDFIRRMGNNAAHSGKKVTEEQAGLCLENLYIFLDFVAYCYGENYTAGHFDRALLEQPAEAPAAQPDEEKDIDLAALMAENAALKEKLTARRAEQQQTYVCLLYTSGVQKGQEYAILTDEVTKAWSGLNTRQYKNLKGLKKENLRDNMSTLELALNMLAEATTTELTKAQNPQGLEENRTVAKQGGTVAGNARKEIEAQTGRPVVTARCV